MTTSTKKSLDVSSPPVSDAESDGQPCHPADDDSQAVSAGKTDGSISIEDIDRSNGDGQDLAPDETLDPVSQYLWSQSLRSVH